MMPAGEVVAEPRQRLQALPAVFAGWRLKARLFARGCPLPPAGAMGVSMCAGIVAARGRSGRGEA